MIIVYHGSPGSGKSYKAVHDLEKYCKTHIIFHNIEGLKHSEFSHPERFFDIREKYFESGYPPEIFFSKEFQTELYNNCIDKFKLPMLLLIDEAAEFFIDQNKIYLKWLAWHRHLGQIIILIVQDIKFLHHTFRKLVNFEYRAKLDLGFLFVYSRIDKEQTIGFFPILKRLKVFRRYKSFEINSKSYKNPFLFVFPFIAVLGLYLFFRNPIDSDRLKKNNQNFSKSQKSLKIDNSSVLVPSFSQTSIASPIYYIGKILIGRSIDTFSPHLSKFLIKKDSVIADYRVFFPKYKFLACNESGLSIMSSDNHVLNFPPRPPIAEIETHQMEMPKHEAFSSGGF